MYSLDVLNPVAPTCRGFPLREKARPVLSLSKGWG